MANMTLKNISQRTFTIGEGRNIKPGQAFVTDPEGGKRLLEMYPGEITDAVSDADKKAAESSETGVADAAPNALPPAPATASVDDMTVKDLKAALTEKGVSFKPNASKADLVALLKNSAAPAPAETVTPVAPTLLAPDTQLELGVVYSDANGTYLGVQNGQAVGLKPIDQLTAEEKAALVAEGKLPA